jgi:general secretion pathway protein A
MRIYELSKKINIGNKEIIAKLAELDITAKSHLSSIDKDTASKLTDIFKQKAKQKSILSEKEESPIKEDDKVIVPEHIKFFGLKKLPFENVPDPKFFFDEGDYARIHNQITGSLKAGRGLIIVTGPIGSGKTTMSQMIKSDFPENIRLIWMAEPPSNSTYLYLFLAQELGLQPTSSEKTFVMRDIRNALLKINSEGKKCLVIMDESHLISDDVVNGIRLLNNLEEGSIKLIQLLLLGQEELMEKINRPEMEPFKQRIAALEILGKMNVDGIRKYVSHRIQVAGGTPSLISDTGWEALSIAFNSGGTPRTINSLCDRSFNVAFEQEKTVVDAQDIYEATQRIGLRTDVFHYIVSLKNRERKGQEPHPAADKPAPETVPSDKEPSPSIVKKAEQSSREAINEVPDTSVIRMWLTKLFPADQKGLKIPMLFLLLFIMILILIIFFTEL